MTKDIQNQLTPQEAYWFEILEESKKSATTQKVFCAKEGIDYGEFKKQRTAIYKKMGKFDHSQKRFRAAARERIDFIPVKLQKPVIEAKKGFSAIKIEIGNISICVLPGFDPTTLKNIIEVIR